MKNVYTCILTTGTNPGSPFCPYEVKKNAISKIQWLIEH